MKIFLYLILFAFLTSCAPKIIQSTKTVEKDSTHVDTVKTKKIVKTKGDSLGMAFKLPSAQIVYPEQTVKQPEETLTFQAEDPIVFKKVQKQGRLTESVTISKKGNVVISCKEDSLKEIIEAQRITIQKFKSVTTTQTNTVVCPPKTRWENICEWWTWITIAMIAGGILYKFRKKIPYLNLIP